MSRRLITAIEVDGAGGHPAAWRGAEVDPAAILTGDLAVRAVQRAEAAAVIGRRTPAPAADTWREARCVVDVSRRLWDSWEDDAIIRDAATGRFIDRDRIHYVDFEGPDFSVKGPSIVPRPPQGHPLTVVRVNTPDALQAVAEADLVLLPGATKLAERLAAVREAGLKPRVLLLVSVLLGKDTESAIRRADGADQVTVTTHLDRAVDLTADNRVVLATGKEIQADLIVLALPPRAETSRSCTSGRAAASRTTRSSGTPWPERPRSRPAT